MRPQKGELLSRLGNFRTFSLGMSCVLLALILVSCAEPEPRELIQTECPFFVGYPEEIECGIMLVPEARGQKEEPMIEIHYAIIKSRHSDKLPDPIVGLIGGPGVRSLDAMDFWLTLLGPALVDRDLIVFDQRGVGYSQPMMNCPEVEEPFYANYSENLIMAEQNQRLIKALKVCRDRLVQEGINLDAYSSAESAADVEDLRRALGIAEWNLYGGSYGTRLALTVMRDYPEGVRSAILDAVYPPQEDLITGPAANMQHALDMLFEYCAADSECSQAYPDLESVFYELVDQVDEEPVTLSVSRLSGTQKYDVVINGDRLTRVILDLLFWVETLPNLPALIYDLHAGSYQHLANLLQWSLFPYDELSEGLYFSIECIEEAPFSSPEEALTVSEEINPRLKSALDVTAAYQICEVWNVSPGRRVENQAVVSDIPTLILSGEHDPITPPAWGRSTAENLSQAQFLEFPGTGHGVLGTGLCANQVVEDFLAAPDSPIDSSCVEKIPVLFAP
jgi:pimeloyl-ACP methyl ester carboxylesterase